MKLKMAENSLFAILLRKPWWISLAIAAGLSLVLAALLPDEYRVVGALSTFPFVVIAALAAWRQAQLPSASEVARTQESVVAMSWSAFSARLEEAFRHDGFEVRPGTAAPVDFELQRQGRRMSVSSVLIEQLRGMYSHLQLVVFFRDGLHALLPPCVRRSPHANSCQVILIFVLYRLVWLHSSC